MYALISKELFSPKNVIPELRNLFIQPLDYRIEQNINQIIIMFKIGV